MLALLMWPAALFEYIMNLFNDAFLGLEDFFYQMADSFSTIF